MYLNSFVFKFANTFLRITSISECSVAKHVSLPDNVSCVIGDTCTDITCCVDVNFLHRTILIHLSIDPCAYEMTSGIEALQVKKSLVDYKWSEMDSFFLQGGIQLQYEIS